jgi:hypothetical protein
MNFVAITYGYQKFAIFNTNVYSQCLIDCVIAKYMEDMNESVGLRKHNLQTEVKKLHNEEELIKTEIKNIETSIKLEESVLVEKMKEVLTVGGKESKRGTIKNTMIQKKISTSSSDPSAINKLRDDYKAVLTKLENTTSRRAKMMDKLNVCNDYNTRLKDMEPNITTMKIDLVDSYGERVNINTKYEMYANQYLQDRQCYELFIKNTNGKNNLLNFSIRKRRR